MRSRNSVIVPVVIILAGAVLELNSLGVFGNALPGNLTANLWPLLAVAAGLDLLLIQRRLIGSLIMLFFGAALLSTQLMDGGWNNPVWEFFMKTWPLLLVLFGIDSIFAGRSLFNAAVIIAAIVALLYAALLFLDVPFLKQLPIDLTALLPTQGYTQPVPQQPTAGPQAGSDFSIVQEPAVQLLPNANGQLSVAMPGQNMAALNLSVISGKISLKADTASGHFMGGTVILDKAESFSSDVNLNSGTAVYTLGSRGSVNPSSTSVWDLGLTKDRSIRLQTVLNSGYLKADLRGLNLSDATLENKYGPIDIMMPYSSTAKIKITAGSGDIRIYIPKNASINCTITGTNQVEYPQMSYSLVNGILAPRRTVTTPVTVEVTSNNGWVRIIESE